MKVRVVVVGKLSRWSKEALGHYEKLLRRFLRLEVLRLPTAGDLNKVDHALLKKKEGEEVRRKIRGVSLCLDKRGKMLNSKEFSELIRQLLGKEVSFIIGGPLGLSEDVLKSCDRIISFSQMTYSHEVAFVVLLEQLFRAFKILRGERYDY